MPAGVRRVTLVRLTGTVFVLLGLTLCGGCAPEAENQPASKAVVGKAVVDEGPIEPAEVELSDPKARIDDEGVFYFEVKYRFAKGKPRKHYLVTVTFPGTKNACLKHMEAWELKTEGLIKDGIPLIERPVTAYEIIFSEADSPQNRYQRISNAAAGTLP